MLSSQRLLGKGFFYFVSDLLQKHGNTYCLAAVFFGVDFLLLNVRHAISEHFNIRHNFFVIRVVDNSPRRPALGFRSLSIISINWVHKSRPTILTAFFGGDAAVVCEAGLPPKKVRMSLGILQGPASSLGDRGVRMMPDNEWR
jgi:hypothetical protein